MANKKAQDSKKLNVLMITPVYPPNLTIGGGVAVTCGALTDKLTARGHTVRVLSPRLGNVDYGTSTLYPNFPVQFPTIRNLTRFYTNIKQADIVVCPDNTVMPFLLFFSHWLNKPLVFNLHTNVRQLLELSGTFGKYVSAPICDGFIKGCSNLTARTFTTSPSYEQVLIGRGYRVDGVFSPRIKLSVFEEEDKPEDIKEARSWLVSGQNIEGKTLLLYVGRFSHEKRIPLLVTGLPEDCVLVIVGDGPGEAGDEVAKLHDPANRVFVRRGMQPQDRLRVLYKASDFLVSASAFESLGMTLCESNLCGTPAIVQNATGFSTQVVHGQNGFLINFEDPEAAKEAIKHAIENKPTKEMIDATIATRWDSHLPNLEEMVIETAAIGGDKSKWGSGHIPMWIMTPCLVVFYIIFWIIGFPFNKVTDRANDSVTPAVFNKGKLAPKSASS